MDCISFGAPKDCLDQNSLGGGPPAMASQPNIFANNTLRQHAPLAFGYSLMIGGTIVIFMLIRSYGEAMTGAAAPVTTNGHK
jgi:hypothetical protein